MECNIKLDATLVHAAMRGLFVTCVIQLGLTAQEASDRAEWLKKQPEDYIDKVVDAVQDMESSDEKVDA